MPTTQPGILALGTRSHHYLEFDVTGPTDGLVAAINRIREGAKTTIGVNVVVGFGPDVWEGVTGELPAGLGGFETITGVDGFAMPAAQHDVWLWLHGTGPDNVFDVARAAARELDGIARVACEQPAFSYQASQDLTGFEDGTENPPLDEATDVITVPEGQPGAGCSVVLVQRWVHDLDGFEEMEEADRELVIGRTLHGSIELDDDRQVPDSHVRRVVIEDPDGEELEIFRRSNAFGGVLEHGLMFVGFSRDRDRLDRMMRRMAGLDDGVRDRLTRYSTPVASAYYVVPPVEALRAIGGGVDE